MSAFGLNLLNLLLQVGNLCFQTRNVTRVIGLFSGIAQLLVQLGNFLARDVDLLLLFLVQLGRHGRFRCGLNGVV